MEVERPKIKNIVFVGTTGNGKSSTCNSIISYHQNLSRNADIFPVGDGIGSFTKFFDEAIVPEINAKLIDSPGFNDTNREDSYIDRLLKNLSERVVDISGKSTGWIDAFVLVTKLNPRAQTLKPDIQHMREIFGKECYKSMILLIIDERGRDSAAIYESILRDANEAIKLVLAARPDERITDWALCWDNINYKEGQFQDLMNLIEGLEPYTHQKFLEAQKDIKDAIDERINAEIEKETKILRREFQANETKMLEEIEKMKQEKEDERRKYEEARLSAEASAKEQMLAMQQPKKKEKWYKKLAKELF